MSATRSDEQSLLFIRLPKFFRNQVVKRVLDERLDKVVGRVVGPGGGAFVALGEGKLTLGAERMKDRLEFQQALVDRAELFNIERGVVDADRLSGVRILIEREQTETVENGLVVEEAVADRPDGVRAEQVAGKRSDPQLRSRPAGLEQAEAGQKREPKVVFAMIGEVAFLSKTAEALETVVAVVEAPLCSRGREWIDKVALLDDEQEEQPIDQPEEVLVEDVGLEGSGLDGSAQGVVLGVCEQAISECADGVLDSTAEATADAGAGINRVLMVALDKALGGGVRRDGEARGMEQAGRGQRNRRRGRR